MPWDRKPMTFLDRALAFVTGALVALIMVFLMLSSTGCSSTSELECPPAPECPVIEEETFACPEPRSLPELVLPSFPPKPLELLELNLWAVSMAETVIARENILLERIDTLEEILDEYRRPPE